MLVHESLSLRSLKTIHQTKNICVGAFGKRKNIRLESLHFNALKSKT